MNNKRKMAREPHVAITDDNGLMCVIARKRNEFHILNSEGEGTGLIAPSPRVTKRLYENTVKQATKNKIVVFKGRPLRG